METYKYNLESFANFIRENNFKSTFEKVEDRNAVIVKVDNFKEMVELFGRGRSFWAIADHRGEDYWNRYVAEPNREQYVYVDFDVKEDLAGSAFAFTFDPETREFTDAATRNNYSLDSHKHILYILLHIFNADNFIEKLSPKHH